MLPVGGYTGLQGPSHLLQAARRLLQAFRRARREAELAHRTAGVPACMANEISRRCSERRISLDSKGGTSEAKGADGTGGAMGVTVPAKWV